LATVRSAIGGALMGVSRLCRALGSTAVVAALFGCNGLQPLAVATSVASTTSPLKASNGDLIYVSNAEGVVDIYTFPALTPFGTINSINASAEGACSDRSGNVFIATADERGAGTIFEFAHGGTSPIAELSDPGYPYGCSVDPKSGNLAVSNLHDPQYSNLGDVAVYPHAQGAPKMYASSEIGELYFCGYDDSGNLYTDGLTNYAKSLFELPKGKSTFSVISLTSAIRDLDAVQWDGHYMTITDYNEGLARN
jgi:hypothetical protein